ncbi:MAG: hypothetical protein GC205_13075 [Bacteroidetes bacterium]|nr:hypothetical protein [Bacteroidota bacterium]
MNVLPVRANWHAYHCIILLMLWCFALVSSQAQPVYTFMDMQTHPTMHVPYPFFGKGLVYFDSAQPPAITHMHQFQNVNYANFLEKNAGARIVVVGALNNEYIISRRRARSIILKQMEYVNQFAAEHPDRFAVARSPQEVRELFHRTHKTIFVHSIEGGKRLINSQEDADFWASQGVAFITLVHLVDCEFGGAAIAPGLATRLINAGASRNLEKEQGLSPLGRNAIRWLANAGILTDLTHMNDRTRADALAVMEAHCIPPLSTHDGFKPIQNQPRALTPEQVLQIYRNDGLVALPVSGFTCMPYEPVEPYRQQLDHMETYCDGSVDSYQFTYLAVKKFVESNPELGYSQDLPDSLKVAFSIGFQSDFNGWLNHSRPRVGPDGCSALHPDSTYEAIEVEGLAHPGLLPSQWRYLEKQGVDLEPIRRASEKFLRMWAFVLAHGGSF